MIRIQHHPKKGKSFSRPTGHPIHHHMTPSMRLRALVIAGALILAACGGAARDDSGAIVEAGTEDVFALKVGDCFNDPDSFGEIESVEAVPCSEPHDNEVFHTFDLPDGAFPGADAIDEAAFGGCLPAFEQYVDVSYQESSLDISYLSPTAESWDRGDREIACLLYDLNLEKLTGSMKGARI